MILHPLAERFNTTENYQILKNWYESHERASENTEMKINISFEKELAKELLKVRNSIDKSIAKIFK